MALNKLATVLFAVLITSVAYGFAVCLFIQSVMAMVRKRNSTGQLNLTLAIPALLIFCFTTTNVLGIWINTYEAFVVHSANPLPFLGLITSHPKTIFQTGQLGAILLTDALVVYRTFVLWNSSIYAIIFPCITFVATFASGVVFVRLQHIVAATTSIYVAKITDWTISFLLCSLVTTVYSTSLIVFKLWKANRALENLSMKRSVGHRVMKILAESAAIYSVCHLLYAILYAVKSDIEATPGYLEGSIASITCSLIIIRCEAVNDRRQIITTDMSTTGQIDLAFRKMNAERRNSGTDFTRSKSANDIEMN